jgi:hypothetical protein
MESKNIVGMSVLGLTFLFGAQGALAQVAVQPQAVPFGSFILVPTLNLKTVSDDNIYSLPSNEVSSFSQILNPNLAFVAQDRLNVYKVVYNLSAASFANDSNDSYADQTFDLSAHVESSARLRLDGGLAYKMLHDDRGTGATSGAGLAAILASGEVDKYDVVTVRGGVEYGAQTARGMIVLTADMNQKRYSRDVVAVGRDNDTLNALLGLRARIMPKTTALVDYEYSDTNYKKDFVKGVGGAPNLGTQDTQDSRILVGLTWENTAQTTGKLRLGQGKRKVDGGADINKFTWDLGAVWKPVQLDTISINGGARATDATAPYTSVENTNYSLSWAHDWLDRFNTAVSLGASKDDYKGNPKPADNRNDDTKTYGVAANYQMRRWLVLNAAINVNDRSSNQANFDSKRNVMSVGAQISL